MCFKLGKQLVLWPRCIAAAVKRRDTKVNTGLETAGLKGKGKMR